MKYLYESDEVVKAYPEKEPDINNPKFWEHVGQYDTWLNESKYRKALKEWEASGKIVDNNTKFESDGIIRNWREKPTGSWYIETVNGIFKLISGQQVETEPSGENVIVTKIY